jgi:hypothetical protein
MRVTNQKIRDAMRRDPGDVEIILEGQTNE